MKRKTIMVVESTALFLLCSMLFVSSAFAQAKITPDEAKKEAAVAQENLAYAVGVQAYLYGQPLMDLYRTFWEGTLDPKRGHDRTLNEFNFVRKMVTAKDTWVVTPNQDTLYSRGFLDLTDEPIVLHAVTERRRVDVYP
jgi:hypothetical protein